MKSFCEQENWSSFVHSTSWFQSINVSIDKFLLRMEGQSTMSWTKFIASEISLTGLVKNTNSIDTSRIFRIGYSKTFFSMSSANVLIEKIPPVGS